MPSPSIPPSPLLPATTTLFKPDLEVADTKYTRTPMANLNPQTLRSIHLNGREYAELLFSEQEVTQIAQTFAHKKYPTHVGLHAKASLAHFRQHAAQYKYILISAHGDYNNEQPELTGILFSPAEDPQATQILYQTDAYNLHLTSDLVVLSCCDTGVGKPAAGEGIMAFNRGFLFAGASNVVYTLFKVYDHAAFELTGHLFTEILSGKAYPAALRAAKLYCIKQASFIPVHWAGYVLVGG